MIFFLKLKKPQTFLHEKHKLVLPGDLNLYLEKQSYVFFILLSCLFPTISFCVKYVKLEAFVYQYIQYPYIVFVTTNELLLLVICGDRSNSVLKKSVANVI